jgi:hypothetical protein
MTIIDATLPPNEGAKQLDAAQVSTGVGTVYQQRVQVIGGFLVPAFDYVAFSYTGTNITGITYKTGGPSGTTVAALSLAYSGSSISSVTRTA